MAADDIFEVTFVVEVNGQPTATVLHCEQSSSGTPADSPADVWAAIQAKGIHTSWQARSSNEVTLGCLKIQKIYPQREPAGLIAPGLVGGISEEAMDSGCSAMHFWQGDGWIPTAKGRHFWAGIPETAVRRNRLVNTAFLLEAAFAAEFNDPMTGTEDYQWGVWSRKLESIAILGWAFPRVNIRRIRSRRTKLCAPLP